MILDTGDEIYLWIGKDSLPEERKMSVKLIKVFIFI